MTISFLSRNGHLFYLLLIIYYILTSLEKETLYLRGEIEWFPVLFNRVIFNLALLPVTCQSSLWHPKEFCQIHIIKQLSPFIHSFRRFIWSSFFSMRANPSTIVPINLSSTSLSIYDIIPMFKWINRYSRCAHSKSIYL